MNDGRASNDAEQPKKQGPLGDLPTLALAIAVALVIRTFVLQSFYVPSDSMFPTMLIGDHVFVNKLLFGLKIPFTDGRTPGFRKPRRGEVIVFKLARGPGHQIYPADLRRDLPRDNFVKRLVGLPGDRIAMRGGRIILNGEMVPAVRTGETFTDRSGIVFDVLEETLGECKHWILDHPQRNSLDEMDEITVRPGRYLFLGDNRDNSLDGRVFGTVRLEELEGPAGLAYWSWDWTGSWASLLNPLTWVENLTEKTRWGRMGRFHECRAPDEPLGPVPSTNAG